VGCADGIRVWQPGMGGACPGGPGAGGSGARLAERRLVGVSWVCGRLGGKICDVTMPFFLLPFQQGQVAKPPNRITIEFHRRFKRSATPSLGATE
jgi:hypothetical protein